MQSDERPHETAGNGAPGEPSTPPGPGRGPGGLLAEAKPFLALAGAVAAAILFARTVAPPGPATPAVPGVAAPSALGDPLSSWHDGPTKRKILAFLADVTRPGTPTFVPPEERVAVFDHDGTLVCEKPIVHGAFLVERVRKFVAAHPEFAHEEPYATLVGGDLEFVRRLGKKFFADLTFTTLAGVPEESLEADVREFLATARHPVFDVPFGDVTFQPMKELVALLRANGFTVWICSGSGIHFMRPAAAAWYGIGPEHVIASRSTTRMDELEPSEPLPPNASPNRRLALVVQPELEVLNDEGRKPVSIGEQIGRRPIFAAGNVGTGGDVEMLRWSQSSPRPNLQLLVLHDDAEREMAYGEPTNESLDAAERYGWQVVKIARDWKQVFATPLTKHAPATTAQAGSASLQPARWEEDIAAYERRDAEQPPMQGGICLVGSSNIRLWTTLGDDFPGMNVVNRGVGGCRLSELAEFAPRLVAAAKPNVVVVSAGTNDIGSGATAQEVLDGFRRIVATLRADLPDVTIAFLAIAPSIKRWEQRERQAAANDAVKAFIASSGDSKLRYLDANAAFLGPDGTPDPACFVEDLQHPSVQGNARRAEILRPLFKELLGP
ncbi:MAG: GDSL-type esterase/lipase family protein [Planctomycetia bacterium]